jgi:hypothetical protein
MKKDGRYKNIKPLFINRTIQRFSDIWIAIRKSVVAGDLGMNNNRFTELIDHPGEFKIREILKLSWLFDLTLIQTTGLIEQDYMHQNSDIDEKDNRYRQVRTMIKVGNITSLSDIFDYVPRYVIARDIGKGRSSLDNVESYTVKQVATFAELCELTFMEMFQLMTAISKKK